MRAVFGTIGGLLAALALAWGLWPWLEPARLWHPVTGIDVSHHQGAIDWPAVAGGGVAFAYVKASEGGDYRDPELVTNWQGARGAGLKVGAYHFYRLCRPGALQAANFLDALPKDPGQLPPVLDVEDMGLCDKGLDPVAEIAAFLQAVEEAAGCRPILYATREFEAAHLAGAFAGEAFWARSLAFPPGFRRDTWVFWQYHNAGRRPGITGPVDLNAFRGDGAGLDRLVKDAGCFQ